MAAKLGLFGPMKTLASARADVERTPDGRLRAWIEHDLLRDVTPEMVRWWFEHIDRFSTFDGTGFDGPAVPVYRFWHPYDHISARWTKRVLGPDGRLGPGSVIHIEEDLGGVHQVRDSARVIRFDDRRFDFAILGGGFLPGATVDHVYEPASGGTHFFTQVTLGNGWPLLGRVIARLVERLLFSEDMLRAWLVHNVEESGETERFVPALWQRARAGQDPFVPGASRS